MEKANIGETLKKLRKERDLTMDMFVMDINQRYNLEINKSQVSRWERNENDPSLALAAKLADYYGVSVDYLLGLTTLKTPSKFFGVGHLNKNVYTGNFQGNSHIAIAGFQSGNLKTKPPRKGAVKRLKPKANEEQGDTE